MKHCIVIFTILFWSMAIMGQNINITFSGSGQSNHVDFVTVMNLKTHESITLPGQETLTLKTSTGLPIIGDASFDGKIFPNPAEGSANLVLFQPKSGYITITINNLVGQLVTSYNQYLGVGRHACKVFLGGRGVYLINVIGDDKQTCIKVICTNSSNGSSYIEYSGEISTNEIASDFKIGVSQLLAYTLDYNIGDGIEITGKSRRYESTIIASPEYSDNYEFEFLECTHPNKTYRTVKIGGQTWTAENLNYLPQIHSPTEGSETDKCYYMFDYSGNDIEKAKESEYYKLYGVLYNWEAAQTACPNGWKLPSDEDWKALETYLGMRIFDVIINGWRPSGEVGQKLKSVSGWNGDNISTNLSGFSALPSSYRNNNGIPPPGYGTGFWSSTAYETSDAWIRLIINDNKGIYRNNFNRSFGYSVRCIQNVLENNDNEAPDVWFSYPQKADEIGGIITITAEASDNKAVSYIAFEVFGDSYYASIGNIFSLDNNNKYSVSWDTNELKVGEYSIHATAYDEAGNKKLSTINVNVIHEGRFTDIRDGFEYSYVHIGTQIWMGQNLAYLNTVTQPGDGSNTEAFSYVYDYDGTNVSDAKSTDNYLTYGVLYNFEAAKNSCPEGWHLPSIEEWEILSQYLGEKSGIYMKSTFGWSNDGNGDNKSRFNGLPSGQRSFSGRFDDLGFETRFWSSSLDNNDVYCKGLKSDRDEIINWARVMKSLGNSVRCLKD